MSHHKTSRELHDQHAEHRLEHAATVRAEQQGREHADARWLRAMDALQMTSSPPANDWPGCTD